MASASVPVKELEDLLECPVCLDLMENPRILQCQHAFCLQCVEGFAGFLEIRCPIDRMRTTMPREGLHALPRDITKNKLTDLVNKQRPADQPPCDMCDTDQRPPRFFCNDCQDYMCRFCADAHSATEIFKDHVIIDHVDLHQVNCEKHGHKYLGYYCVCCEVAVCRQCVAGKHRSHAILEMKEHVFHCSQELEQLEYELNSATKASYDVYAVKKKYIKDIVQEIDSVAERWLEKITDEQLLLEASLKKDRQRLKECYNNSTDAKALNARIQELRAQVQTCETIKNPVQFQTKFKQLSKEIKEAIAKIDAGNQHFLSALDSCSIPKFHASSVDDISIGRIVRSRESNKRKVSSGDKDDERLGLSAERKMNTRKRRYSSSSVESV